MSTMIDERADEPMEAAPRSYSAVEIAELLELPRPTDEQILVIEAPLQPAMVVAGAGSGKTETMANRIVWLLANRLVEVPQILGLTFTRKAAGELQERILARIQQLGRVIEADSRDILEAPTVSTYNAFASGIFREYGRSIGREPESTVITDASAWRLARDIVIRSDDDRLVTLDKSIDQITSAVVWLSRSLSDNDAADRGGDILRMVERVVQLEEMPWGSRKRTPSKMVVDTVRDLSALPVLLALADDFAREKRRRGFVEFSDQVALALEICRRVPRAREDYRSRFRVVILDEYQDTSVVQTDLLSGLFADHPVMAVGDPNQSIYGWRGASASNLARYLADFAPASPSATYSLSTSWRNAHEILAAANAVAGRLPVLPTVPVSELRASPAAADGRVEVSFTETIEDEAREVAEWFRRELRRPTASGKQRTAALLCRSVKNIAPFTDALDAADVPYHVLGLAGLLEQPVIVDLVAALRVLHDPTAGSELIRLLTGARWQIGPRDIAALNRLAAWLSDRDTGYALLDDSTREALRQSTNPDDARSLVEAIDFLIEAPDTHRALAGITAEGRRRMRVAATQLAGIRRRGGLDLLDLVSLVVQELLLDIEIAANETATLGQASLDAFVEQVESYLAVDESGTLGPFLAWLDEAEKREKLAPRSDEPEPGTVQILTIHGSKGLEWDSVAVPRLVADEMPGKLRSKRGWTAFGELPFDFRGDRDVLPELQWRSAETHLEFDEAYSRFGEELEQRNSEEQRRLAYVAITRARDALHLGGSFWATQSKPREASTYLRETEEALERLRGAEGDRLPAHSEFEENPLAGIQHRVEWPLDPLGPRRERVTAAARAVREADPERATRWDADIALLLAEREDRRTGDQRVALPARVPASRFKDFVSDPAEVATRLRRPLPEKPYRQTRLGTLFHSWVEQRSGMTGTGDVLDASMLELDGDDLTATQYPVEGAELDALRALQTTFEASEWAEKKPVDVEIEIDVTLGGQVLICKLDAVYETDGRYQIVDWKTGRSPRGDDELEERQYQLALYRVAYARWKGIPAEDIDAVFYYVAEDTVIRPRTLYSEEELVRRWTEAVSRA